MEPDAIVVGAGPAGSAAAIRMAQKGLNVYLIDRGEPVGSKNLSGGVLWGRDLDEITPDWEEEAPVERFIVNKKIGFLSDEDATVFDLHFDSWTKNPKAGWSVLRAYFDGWMASKAQEAGAAILSGINIDSLIEEDGKIVGVRQQDEEIRAPLVVIAEGANPRLMLKHGMTYDPDQTRYEYEDFMIGIKEVYELDQEKLEERFLLDEGEGMAGEFIMGNLPDELKAGGFFYTNKTTLSVGVVVHLDSFERDAQKSNDMQSYKVIEYFTKHPYIRRLLKDAELLEYGAKIIPEYGWKKFPEHYGDGYMVVGDAAGFTFSNGLIIQGINYAIKSGILAADTAVEAKEKSDFSARTLKGYRKRLEESYIYKDFKKFKDVKKMTKNKNLFKIYPEAINNTFKDLLTEDGSPKDHVISTLIRNMKKSGAGYWTLLKDGLKARKL